MFGIVESEVFKTFKNIGADPHHHPEIVLRVHAGGTAPVLGGECDPDPVLGSRGSQAADA